jgi:hypothetical protein
MRRGSKSNEIRVFCRRLRRVGVEGRLKPDAFHDAYGPVEAVPILQSSCRLSIPEPVKPDILWVMLMARLKPCP